MLNISPLNFVKLNNSSFSKQYVKQGLSSDVFVKSPNNTAFKGAQSTNSANSFIKWAQDTKFTENQLTEILLNPDNIIGSGFSNTAYKIPGNDSYILRVLTSSASRINPSNIPNAKLKDTKDKNPEINIGQKVAEIEIPGEYTADSITVEVLKRQNGESIGVQPPETLCNDFGDPLPDVISYEDYSRKEKYARTIHKVAQLPVESFEKLISDFTKASEAGYHFDHLNSNNLLVDSEDESINLIDMSIGSGKPVKPNYSNLLYSLTNISYLQTYISKYPNPVSDEDKNTSIEDTINIISKFMEAMQNQGAKFDRDLESIEFGYKFKSSLPCKVYCRSYDDNGFWHKAEAMGLVE